MFNSLLVTGCCEMQMVSQPELSMMLMGSQIQVFLCSAFQLLSMVAVSTSFLLGLLYMTGK